MSIFFDSEIVDLFAGESIARGEDYFFSHRVKVLKDTDDDLIATVFGKEEYRVRLILEKDDERGFAKLTGACSCFRFEQRTECKHLWALLLKARSLRMRYSAQGYAFEPHFISGKRGINEFLFEESGSQAFSKNNFRFNNFLNILKSQDGVYEVREKDKLESSKKEIFYALQGDEDYRHNNTIIINYKQRSYLKSGKLGKIKKYAFNHTKLSEFDTESLDKEILSSLSGFSLDYYNRSNNQSSCYIPKQLMNSTLAKMSETGRLVFEKRSGEEPLSISWKEEPWSLQVSIAEDETGSNFITAKAKRGIELVNLEHCLGVYERAGLILIDKEISPFRIGENQSFIRELRFSGWKIPIPEGRKEDLTNIFLENVGVDFIEETEQLGIKKVDVHPMPTFHLDIDFSNTKKPLAWGRALFDYRGSLFKYGSEIPFYDGGVYFENVEGESHYYVKKREVEPEYIEKIKKVNEVEVSSGGHYKIPLENLSTAIEGLMSQGFDIISSGSKVRSAAASEAQVKSSHDWFEIKGKVKFGQKTFTIPEVLKKIKKDKLFITLGDGELGMIPNQWVDRYKRLLEIGRVEDDGTILVDKSQALLIDALLDEKAMSLDKEFRDCVERLQSFDGKVQKIKPCSSFKGELREYQEEGLGWFKFIQELRIGGCLADDMGLGKTVQVLALLSERKSIKNPSVIIVPKSLIYNWKNEAKKFAPHLSITEYGGSNRDLKKAMENDIILMSYGILQKDALKLSDKESRFDYIILDEAQWIKNSKSKTAKAACLLNGDHRLALTGTPVENSLSDLFSIFKFLMPGVFGFKFHSEDFKSDLNIGQYILKGLRPYILRRTKEEVLTDLPEKVEDILYCELEGEQKAFYEKLKAYYQAEFSDKKSKKELTIESTGEKKGALMYIEAMLRLRQSSCHLGLVDKNLKSVESSKLKALVVKVREIKEAGHKCVIFSQFTSFLSIVKKAFEDEGIYYEYLDGQSKNREEIVNRFKKSQSVSAFLISLKAGGVGLNLTEASYCFILDPWWNPAAESQAIDRIYRIGQKRNVTAYKLVAKGTIEEKVLALQAQKKKTAEGVLSSDESFFKGLSKSEIRYLFM